MTWPGDPLGRVNKPMTDDHVREKFVQTVEPVYGKEKTARVLERWWKINGASATEISAAPKNLDLKR